MICQARIELGSDRILVKVSREHAEKFHREPVHASKSWRRAADRVNGAQFRRFEPLRCSKARTDPDRLAAQVVVGTIGRQGLPGAAGFAGAGGSSPHHHCVGTAFTRGHISSSVLPSYNRPFFIT